VKLGVAPPGTHPGAAFRRKSPHSQEAADRPSRAAGYTPALGPGDCIPWNWNGGTDWAGHSQAAGPGQRRLVLGLGGTLRAGSSSETALALALEAAHRQGAETVCFAARDLQLPHYDPSAGERTVAQDRLVTAFRRADGLIIASPGYHGAVSGLIKNALDHAEDLARDERVYLSGIPIGCIGVASGPQAATFVLQNLRTIAHALRGIPTPYGASVVVSEQTYRQGRWIDPGVRECLTLVGTQVAAIAAALAPSSGQPGPARRT
jgi:FMN reductase